MNGTNAAGFKVIEKTDSYCCAALIISSSLLTNTFCAQSSQTFCNIAICNLRNAELEG